MRSQESEYRNGFGQQNSSWLSRCLSVQIQAAIGISNDSNRALNKPKRAMIPRWRSSETQDQGEKVDLHALYSEMIRRVRAPIRVYIGTWQPDISGLGHPSLPHRVSTLSARSGMAWCGWNRHLRRVGCSRQSRGSSASVAV